MRIFLVLFLAALFIVIGGERANALSCIQPPITHWPSIYSGADEIFLGDPLQINSSNNYVDFRVLENFKGASKGSVKVYYHLDIAGASKPNRRVLVIAKNVRGNLYGSLCWGHDQNLLGFFRFIKYGLIFVFLTFLVWVGYRKFFKNYND